jgi:hypothetical protein
VAVHPASSASRSPATRRQDRFIAPF